jgi:carbamoylphosphate synthase large subunit
MHDADILKSISFRNKTFSCYFFEVFDLKRVNVLITCAGGVISPSHIGSLRDNPDGRSLRVVATDATIPCIAQYVADRFYQVPFGSSPDYVERLLDICTRESVEVVFPASHEEALVLARNRKMFEEVGTVIAVSKFSVLELACNKKLAYQKLKDAGLPYAEFYAVKTFAEFEEAAAKLGIDSKKVVMKTLVSRGGRGTRILTKGNTFGLFLNEKPGFLEQDYDMVCQMLRNVDAAHFPELVLMEYLPGPIVSVDFLTKDGHALIVVPKIRVFGNASQTLVGKVHRDPDVEESITRISEVFGFDYNVNIELAYTSAGAALPFDFNPRIAASVAFCSAVGANLIYFALKMALGEEVPKVEVKDGIMMLRSFKELYVDPYGKVLV